MRRIERDDIATTIIEFEGSPLTAFKGDNVAAALLAANHVVFRTTSVSNTVRGPLCMMGVCFDCLVEIDGVGNQQACMIEVREGMVVKRQQGAVDISQSLTSNDRKEPTS